MGVLSLSLKNLQVVLSMQISFDWSKNACVDTFELFPWNELFTPNESQSSCLPGKDPTSKGHIYFLLYIIAILILTLAKMLFLGAWKCSLDIIALAKIDENIKYSSKISIIYLLCQWDFTWELGNRSAWEQHRHLWGHLIQTYSQTLYMHGAGCAQWACHIQYFLGWIRNDCFVKDYPDCVVLLVSFLLSMIAKL